MAHRTFAVGDIHGEMATFHKTLCKLPALDEKDTLVLLGDYIDRGPQSAQVIDYIRRELPRRTRAKLVVLRGNHEDGWLRVAFGGWVEFTIPPVNGCLAALRSYRAAASASALPTPEEITAMRTASFFPRDVLDWMHGLPYFYEDEHAIYVHAGLVEESGRWLHPSETKDPSELLWSRSMRFYQGYRGKRVICGHTNTGNLPPELSSFTPDDPLDMWVGENVTVIDTGCGREGFLTILELPSMKVYESRD